MKFRTTTTFSPWDFKIDHHDKILMMGSCFTENISSRMQSAGFTLDTNPFGIVYNPQSLIKGLSDLITCRRFTVHDLFENQGVFHSLSHHSRFSDISPEMVLEKINERVVQSSAFLRQSSVLMITFGTAFVYKLLSNGEVVSNCHKLPDRFFQRSRLSIHQIVDSWTECISLIRKENPTLKIIFTVSPIRHLKDGMHENQLSKSILLLAVDQLVKTLPSCYYFPSYEIMLDDLRDYRFYEDDMVHPSDLAVGYIWELFSSQVFGKDTLKLIKEWREIQQVFNHRPFNPDSKEHQEFLRKVNLRKVNFCQNNPSFR